MAARAALITGASSGIGLAIAKVLADEGFELTVTARRPDKLEQAAEELRALGTQVRHVPGNVAVEEDIVAAVARHRDGYGRMDVLVNNAGLGIGGPGGERQTKDGGKEPARELRSLE